MEIKLTYEVVKLNESQLGMLYHCLDEESPRLYTLQRLFKSNLKIDKKIFIEALRYLLLIHPAMKSKLSIDSGSVLIDLDEENFFEVEWCEKVHKVEEISQILKKDFERGFNLNNETVLIRFKIIPSNDCDYLLITNHHILMDGWSSNILLEDLINIYSIFLEGLDTSRLEGDIIRGNKNFKAYNCYINSFSSENILDGIDIFWKKYLKDINVSSILCKTKNLNNDSGIGRRTHKFSKNIVSTLKEHSINNRVTLNSILETLLGITFNFLNGGTTDTVYCKVTSGRHVDIDGVDEIFGSLINTIPCRICYDSEDTLLDVVKNNYKNNITSLYYSHVPVRTLLKYTDLNELPECLFSFENYRKTPSNDKSSSLHLKKLSTYEETSFPLSINCLLDNNELIFELEYKQNIVSEYTIEAFLDKLIYVMNCFVQNPSLRIKDLDITLPEERLRILSEFNATDKPYDDITTLIEHFEKQVASTPQKIAVRYEGNSMTYSDLNARSNQVAHYLRKQGIGRGDFVGLLTDRSLEMIVGIYGILKAGAAYVPIDTTYPIERISYILQKCNISHILVHGFEYSQYGMLSKKIVEIFQENFSVSNLIQKPQGNDIAYCIFTSGSTGEPKGVVVKHRSINNLLNSYEKIYALTENDNVLQVSNYTFDQSVWDIFGVLIIGGTLCLISKDDLIDPIKLKDLCLKYNITLASFTPALLNELAPEDFPSIRVLDSSGDVASISVLHKWFYCGKTVINTYGPTEITVNSSSYVVNGKEEDSIPIGKPIDNTKYYILNDELKLCGIGVIGELYIAGDGVSEGYISDKNLTNQVFQENIFGSGLMYKTGDLARWLPDGNVEYIGRKDNQVKIRGYRVELNEIESKIRQLKDIVDCAVTTQTDDNNDKLICAYIVARNKITLYELNSLLEKTLPKFMLPQMMKQLVRLPMTTNGKIDRKSLPPIDISLSSVYLSPVTEQEKVVCDAFSAILGVKRVGIGDNFYALGGDSIKSIRLVSKIRESGFKISVRDIMLEAYVSSIAKKLIPLTNNYDDDIPEGIVSNTPIVNRFLEFNFEEYMHYNQSILIRIPESTEKQVTDTMYELIKHHDILRAHFNDGRLFVHKVGEFEYFGYQFLEVEELTRISRDYFNQVHQRLDIINGPLIQLVNIRTKKGQFLFICMHHLIVDGVSWRILHEDILRSLNQLKSGERIQFPPKTLSFRKWSQYLEEYKDSEQLKMEKTYWKQIRSLLPKGRLIGMDNCTNGNFLEIDRCSITLTEEETAPLLHSKLNSFNVSPLEVLLVSLSRAINCMTGQKILSVILEGHGREQIHQVVDIDRTVGWFTTEYPVILKTEPNIKTEIIETKEMLKNIPNNGIGYGLLYNDFRDVHVIFNYMGEMDSEQRGENLNSLVDTGDNVSSKNNYGDVIRFNAQIVNKQLVIDCIKNRNSFKTISLKELSELFRTNMLSVIAHVDNFNRQISIMEDEDEEQILVV